jgi:hypothetical protein
VINGGHIFLQIDFVFLHGNIAMSIEGRHGARAENEIVKIGRFGYVKISSSAYFY